MAHVDHTVEPGGAEIALRRLLEGKPAWNATVFLPPTAGGRGAYMSLPDTMIEIVGVPQQAGAISGSLAAKIGMLAGVVRQGFALRRSKCFREQQVVHANTSRAALIATLATAFSRRRLVVHLRDAVEPEAIGGVAVRAMSLALKQAHGVIANSDYTLQTAARWIRDDAVTAVIPSSVGHRGDRPIAPLREAVSTVGMLARLAPWKGQAEVLQAFAAAFADSDVRLQFAGSAAFGEEVFARELQELAKTLGIDDRVDFLGHVGDVWPLLEQWDICVHASTRPEPMGQNLLQYLAAARPTIAAAAGGPLEWVRHGETGVLTKPGDVSSLAQAMRRVADEPDLRARLHANLRAEQPVPRDSEISERYADFFARVASTR
ncbi:glycosyltransferase [Microbacterium sp. MEC084]|nr:glycosyltransferase [Microbacterium sp. MEC084]